MSLALDCPISTPEASPRPPVRQGNQGAQARIILIDSDDQSRVSRQFELRREGHQLVVCSSAAAAASEFAKPSANLVLLSESLKDTPALELCQALRERHPTLPIVILGDGSDEAKLNRFLEVGADDYLCPPFSTRWLAVKVRTTLRRTGFNAEGSKRIEWGGVALDHVAHTAFVNGSPVYLTATEYRLLLLLLTNPGHTFNRHELLDHAWPPRSLFVGRRVDTVVKRLRRKLGALGRLVETVRGTGYRIATDTTA